jgi:hypothetical protein
MNLGKNYLTLSHKIELYLPTRTVTHDLIDESVLHVLRDKLARQLSAMFGGATVTPAVGFYENHALGGLQLEDVEILFSYAKSLSREQAHELIKMAEEVKKTLSQESVMIVFNGKAILV